MIVFYIQEERWYRLGTNAVDEDCAEIERCRVVSFRYHPDFMLLLLSRNLSPYRQRTGWRKKPDFPAEALGRSQARSGKKNIRYDGINL